MPEQQILNNQPIDGPIPSPQPISTEPIIPSETITAQKPNNTNLYIIVALVVLIGLGVFYYFNFIPAPATKPAETVSDSVITQPATPPAESFNTNLESMFADITKIYSSADNWQVLNNRQAYQFFPNEIKGLPLAVEEIAVIVDTEYNPATTYNLDPTTIVPLRNAYTAYYRIPKALAADYKISESDVIFPINVKAYEFDRPLTSAEVEIIKSIDIVNCFNEEADITEQSYENDQLIAHNCNLYPTEEQRTRQPEIFDNVYVIYFKERNILAQIVVNTQFIPNSKEAVSDYLLKLFNSNLSLFITEGQISTPAERREFEEWRKETFDR